MPRRFRKYNRRRRTGRKGSAWGRWFRKGVSPMQAASAALSGVRYLKGLVNSEMDKFTLNDTSVAISNSTYTSHLTAIAQGDSDSQRTGNSIFVRASNLKGYFYWNSSATYLATTIRVALVQDTQQIGDTSPGYVDVYTAANPISHLNSATVGRFKILKTVTFTLDSVNNKSRVFSFNLPMRHHVRYNGSSASDIQKGGLYLMMCSDVAAASNPPTVTWENRISYHDN